MTEQPPWPPPPIVTKESLLHDVILTNLLRAAGPQAKINRSRLTQELSRQIDMDTGESRCIVNSFCKRNRILPDPGILRSLRVLLPIPLIPGVWAIVNFEQRHLFKIFYAAPTRGARVAVWHQIQVLEVIFIMALLSVILIQLLIAVVNIIAQRREAREAKENLAKLVQCDAHE